MAESGMESNEGRSKFNLNWSPEAPAGIEFKNVVPDDFGSGYQALPAESEQTELKTKMRSSRLRSRRHSKVINFTKKPKSFNFLKKLPRPRLVFKEELSIFCRTYDEIEPVKENLSRKLVHVYEAFFVTCNSRNTVNTLSFVILWSGSIALCEC